MRNEGATGLATLLALADSRLPIGGHVHSGGVEEAVSSGLLRDNASVELYLRRRICTAGLVTASLAAAVCDGALTPERAELEADARTPSPAARTASRAQGRGLLRLAKQLWPHHDWAAVGPRPHLPTVFGMVGAASGASTEQLAGVVVYTTLTGAATAAQPASPPCPIRCRTRSPNVTCIATCRCSRPDPEIPRRMEPPCLPI
jgi:urease accessory protein